KCRAETEDGGRKTEDREQRTEYREQRTEDRGRKTGRRKQHGMRLPPAFIGPPPANSGMRTRTSAHPCGRALNPIRAEKGLRFFRSLRLLLHSHSPVANAPVQRLSPSRAVPPLRAIQAVHHARPVDP